VFTLTSVNPNIDWFQIDAVGFADGDWTTVPYDPHYPGRSGSYPASVTPCTGNRAINVTGGPFKVGDVIDVSFPADLLSVVLGYTSEFTMPSTFTCASAMFYVVSP
jgi:hypothetical protein